MPAGVDVMDVGIGGIHLIQELHERFDALIVIDAVDFGRHPGTVLVIRPEIRQPQGRDDLADVHYSTPERALMLAGALDVVPETVWLVGAQPEDADSLGLELSAPMAGAIAPATAEVRRLLAELGAR